MAGKSLFKHGRHTSRDGIGRGIITASVADKLKDAISGLFEKPISDMDFSRLLGDVALARAHPKPVGKNEMGLMMHRVAYFSGCVSEPDIEINILEAVPPPVAYEIRRKDVDAQLRATPHGDSILGRRIGSATSPLDFQKRFSSHPRYDVRIGR